MHPSMNGNLKGITVLRRFKSTIAGDMMVHLFIHHGGLCGDGVLAQLYFGSRILWGPIHILAGSDPVLWNSDKIKIQTDDIMLLMISPIRTDNCDSVMVQFELTAEETLFF